jgi:hypothetical protein
LQGQWGLFHETGHNHQSADWTFAGTSEVTVNLFSLYVYKTVCGLEPKSIEVLVPDARTKRIRTYFSNGCNFEKWKLDPWLGLEMYIQMVEAFGWDSYKKVFADYHLLPENEHPKTDDDKRDQWMVRFSRIVGKNLGPFFEAWAVPTSRTARDSIADLPVWMPNNFPPSLNPKRIEQ